MLKNVMLACNKEISPYELHYPVLVSYKFDGIRGLCLKGDLYTRSLKKHPNKHLPEYLKELREISIDRKLVFDFELYDFTATYHGQLTSTILAFNASIPITLTCQIFDMLTEDEWYNKVIHRPFSRRVKDYTEVIPKKHPYNAVTQIEIGNPRDLEKYFRQAIKANMEGLIVRSPYGRYKHGRATFNEHLMYKFKDTQTVDCVIVEVVEGLKMKKGIERRLTPTGYLDAVHTKDSFEPAGMAGALIVKAPDGSTCKVGYGEGFTMKDKKNHWINREKLKGRIVEVKALKHGAKNNLRMGKLVKIRDPLDQ